MQSISSHIPRGALDILSILSCHVETVCVLGNKNRKPDDYLKVNIDVDKIHDILDKEKAEKEAKEKSQSE